MTNLEIIESNQAQDRLEEIYKEKIRALISKDDLRFRELVLEEVELNYKWNRNSTTKK